MSHWLECIDCGTQFDAQEVRYACRCGGLLSVERDDLPATTAVFDARRTSRVPWEASGVWRFKEGLLHADTIVTHPEGATRHYERAELSAYAGAQISLKHEGENPTGSFKDRGMTVAITQAVKVGARAVACASTGNTSSSLAAYAAQAGKKAIVFLPAGKVSQGKLAQTLAYGALCLKVRGDFDAAMTLVDEAASRLGIYLLNSKNPFRIEGQKTIVWEILQDLGWEAPDWISVPAGNLGNTSAFGKALKEAHAAGWIKKMPRLLSVQAQGANPFYRGFSEGFKTRHTMQAETIATAIRIGNPISWKKAVQALQVTNGIVTEVTDAELMHAKQRIDFAGIGCEPASACSVAGVKKMVAQGIIKPQERVVCVLTGHVLKDAEAVTDVRPPIEVDATIGAVEKALEDTL